MPRPGQSYEPPLFAWNVGSVVAEICQRAGLPYDAVETDLLEGHVEGFSTTNGHSAASAIEALAGLYLFDPANYDAMLHFIPRGGNAVAAIELDDLVDDGEDVEVDTRRDSIEVPRTLHLEYYDTDGGLTPDKQTSDRTLDNRSVADSKTETTVIMRADDAARAVVIKHKVAVEEARGTIQFSLPDAWIALSTADVILFRGQRMRITECKIDDGLQVYSCTYDRASAYESTISGVPVDPPAEPPSLVAGESRIVVIDSHILASADDTLGYYVAVSSLDLDWKGAFVELSRDGGVNWTDSDASGSNVVIGQITAAVPARSEYIRDDFSVVEVELLREDMELLPATMQEMMNRANLALIGNEIINFSGVTQTGAKTWQLTGLLRGRKGSGAVAHAAGERFVLLDVDSLEFVQAEPYDLNRTLTFRATSIGREGPDQTVSLAFQGVGQKERAPAYLHAKRSGADLIVTWQGVGRLGGGASVGMGAYFTGYRVTLGTTTVDTTSRTATIPYAAGTLSVRQLNSITGPGPAATVTV